MEKFSYTSIEELEAFKVNNPHIIIHHQADLLNERFIEYTDISDQVTKAVDEYTLDLIMRGVL